MLGSSVHACMRVFLEHPLFMYACMGDLLSLLLLLFLYTNLVLDNKLAQDKGGPSKGGFLNNILFSCTVLYLRN